MKVISTNNAQINNRSLTANNSVVFTSALPDGPLLIYKKTPVYTKEKKNIFNKLGKALRSVVNTVKEEIKSTIDTSIQYVQNLAGTKIESRIAEPITKTTISTSKQPSELENLQKEFEPLLQQYYTLLGPLADVKKYAGWKTLTLSALNTMITEIKEAISHEKMMKALEIKFTKGARHYLSKRPPFNYSDIYPLKIPNKSDSYKKGLKELAVVYLKNSAGVDQSLILFSELSHNFFSEAAQSIKEIYAIQADPANKWLERIPKLGIIPKALRVKEQVRLTKCILKDYRSVSEAYVSRAMNPYLKEYNSQLKLIKDYIAQHKIKSFLFKGYTKNIISVLEEAREKRMDAGKQLLDNYAANGANLSKMCSQIQKNGCIDLARKTLFTLLPLC